MKQSIEAPFLSIVVPCHNEEDVVGTTFRTLSDLARDWRADGLIAHCEILFVNNGSTDNTFECLSELASPAVDVSVVDLRRNFGFQGSISAGLAHARGDAVVTIDADLQDDPTKIRDMVEHYRQGTELVLGVRNDRRSDSFLKRVFSEAYYSVLALLGVESVYNHAYFRLMSRALVNEFVQLPERNRYIRALILQLDSRYKTVEYERAARQQGETKFTPGRLINLAVDGVTSFSSTPVRMVTLTGLIAAALSFAGIMWVISSFAFGLYDVPGWASLATILLGFFGLQTFFLGVIGEYIAKIYLETKQRPVFTVRGMYINGERVAPEATGASVFLGRTVALADHNDEPLARGQVTSIASSDRVPAAEKESA